MTSLSTPASEPTPAVDPAGAEASSAARHTVRLAVITVLAIVAAGLLAIPRAGTIGYTLYSLFFEQFAKIEGPALVLVGLFGISVLFYLRRAPDSETTLPQWRYRPWIIVACAVLAAVIVYVGIDVVFHKFLLADDENAAWVQALIFARGRTTATVPPDWCYWISALTPTSIKAGPDCSWHLAYLPLHSLFQVPFIAIGLDRLGGPVAAGLSICLVASIARKQWPDQPARAYLAALVMATSTQILFMSMTMFAMSTHLLVSLVWLWLYVDDRPWSNALLPWVGFIGLGVHSPFPHLFFVPPFLFRYLLRRRWVLSAYVGAVYLFGIAYWHGFYISTPGAGLAPAAATISVAETAFHLPTLVHGFTIVMHLALIPTWNTPAFLILVVAAMLSWRSLDAFSRDATLSLFVTLAGRILLPNPQGEGWGYRYIYDNLGCLALLAAVGVGVFAQAIGARRALRLVGASLALSLLVQLPMRARQVGQIISPYRTGYEWMSSLPFDAVVFPAELVHWGRQLVRNDPFLRNRPKIVSRGNMTKQQRDSLMHDTTKQVKVLTHDELRDHGFPLGGATIGSFLIAP